MASSLSSEDAAPAILVEILSCQNLIIADKRTKSSDPYCKAKLGTKDLHETKCCKKTLNPTFGDAQNNSFILDIPSKELYEHNGLLFKVKDWDRFGHDDDLGTVQVPASDLYKASGEPLEYKLTPPAGHSNGGGSIITIRTMPASDTQLEKFGKKRKGLRGFMHNVQSDWKGKIAHHTKDVSAKLSPKRSLASKNKKDGDISPEEASEKGSASAKEDKAESEASVSTTTTSEKKKKKKEAPKEKVENANDQTIDEAITTPALAPPPMVEEQGEEVDPMMAASAHSNSSSRHTLVEELKLAIEIVGARGILIGDKTSSDPYCKVSFGNAEIHKTKHIMKTLNPIFTPELNSTFVLNTTNKELTEKNGLVFTVKDWDFIGSNDVLGTVEVAAPALMGCTGQTMEFMIMPPKGREKEEAGYLLIRCRSITKEEEHAFQKKKHKQNMFGTTTESAAQDAWPPLPDPVIEQPKPKQSTVDVAEEVDRSVRGTIKEAGGDASESSALGSKEVDDMEAMPKPGEELHLKVEVVSCRGLLIADKTTSDPYVKIYLGEKEIHKTKHILKTLDPVYSPEHHNTFYVHCPAKDLFDVGGLIFRVKDWDRFGKNDDLGIVRVPAKRMYPYSNGKGGEDIEFKLNPPKGQETEDAGYITIRCSQASPEEHTEEKKGFFGLKAPGLFHHSGKRGLDASSLDHGGSQDHSIEPTPVFIEIVSCKNLVAADKSGASDPYVKVKFNKGRKDLHETKHISQTLNPTYSPETNSFFVLDTNAKEILDYGGLVFKIKDWDLVGKNDDLGHVEVSPNAIYDASGENMELKVIPPKGHTEAGYITIRIRPALESDRVAKKTFLSGFKKAMAPTKDYGPADLSLLVEVVSCWKLPIADLVSTDPYVKIKIGPRNVHETKALSKTREPIFTIKHNNLCIVDLATKELTENGGMIFKVKDYDLVGRNDTVGSVTVPAETILKSKGERLEYALETPNGKEEGFIALRFRPATNYDRQFLDKVSGNRDKKKEQVDFMGIDRNYKKVMEPFSGTGRLKALMKRSTKEENGVKKLRIRPYPDPESSSSTEWLTEEEIEEEANKGSKRWLDIGSGDLGRVYVEVIGADGLPNKDKDIAGTGNKTDAFVAVVYEDCVAKTDVIDDCLSPRWMPWTQRAFIFRRMHASSNLHVAVFDYDPGKIGDHDICGRVSVDLSNLRADTEYLLKYNLYENSVKQNREQKGSITLRLRMELKSEKELILANLQAPPEFYVNVKGPKDFDLVRQTVGGRQDFESYSTKTIQMYVDELMAYKYLQYYIYDAVVSLIFWRGQVPFLGTYIPIHSAIAFLSGVILAERPSLYPAFFFFSIAWALIAAQIWRNCSPNPWQKSKTFAGFLSALVTGVPISLPPQNITAHQNEEESKEAEETFQRRMEKAIKDAEEKMTEQMKLQQEHEEMLADAGDQYADTNIATKKEKLSFDPLKFVLYPIQQYLAMICTGLRFVRNVFMWDEPYIAFFLTAACIIIGFVFLFVPWSFLFRWTSRIVVWLGLGPHMKLADIYWYRSLEELGEEERKQKLKDALHAQLEAARANAAYARIQRENAQKLKDFKMALYGRFITKVPVLRLERFPDIPLHASTAKPYKAPKQRMRESAERVGGQQLVGTMVPKLVDDEDAPKEETSAEAKKNV